MNQEMVRPRGRPKNSDIEFLIIQGLNEQSKIKCTFCNRSFVRYKNLNAHISAHKADKKYVCNFPQCSKKFVQSSQLNCHKYTHSEEKPFKCPADGCMVRQRHSNRYCTSHGNLKLIKQPEDAEEVRLKFYRNVENLSEDQKNWFEEYMSEREKKQQTAPTKKRKIDDVEVQKEIHKDGEKEIHQDIQLQIENNYLNFSEEANLFFWFVNDLHEKGVNSKALFKKSCDSKDIRVPVANF